MESDKLRKKLEEELRKTGISQLPIIDRAMVVSYLARLSETELQKLLAEVKRLRNGIWEPLTKSRKYTHKEPKKKDKKKVKK